MKFGKIGYLNLAPFDVFVKRYPIHSSFKSSIKYNIGYPSQINKKFIFRKVDAGFISSIAAVKAKKTKTGIISYGEVWSVIAIKQNSGFDYQSASSNALAKILKIEGQVLIGDRALRYKLANPNNTYIDLGKEWNIKERLPFIFGLLCYNKCGKLYNKLSEAFNKNNIKLPYYILTEYSRKTNVQQQDIKKYLRQIKYKVTNKSKVGLARFYRAVRVNRIKVPSRF